MLPGLLDDFGLPAVMNAITIKFISSPPKPETSLPRSESAIERSLTVKEIGEVTRLHPSTIYDCIRDGRLKHWRVKGDNADKGEGKGDIRVTESALKEFIAERQRHGQVSQAASNLLVSRHDRSGPETPAATTGTHPGRTRQASRSPRNNLGALGNGPGENS